MLLIENIILKILNNICGYSILELINYINYKVSYKDKLNKGFIGKLIESYINFFNNNNNICDINCINLEIKTFSLDINMNLNNDISLISINNLFNFNIFFIKKFFYKIKNILFVIILNDYDNYSIENNLIFNYFILKFDKNDLLNFYNELFIFKNYIIKNNLFLNNFYTNSFRFQIINNNNIKKLNIFFNKKFMLKILYKFNILN